MDKYDKGKLKVLIKVILLQRSPKKLTANQISNIINSHRWGFKTDVTSSKISRLLLSELRKSGVHFMDKIKSSSKRNGVLVYYYDNS